MKSAITRKTKAREFITQIFHNTPEPISLGDLHHYIKIALPNTAYSTVFRLVQKLEKEALIHKVDWRDRGSRYECSHLPHHHHIVCQLCGKITDLDDSILNFNEDKINKKTGYITKYHSIELEGICPECQKKKRKSIEN